jgi:hypothetical protein
VKVLTAMIVFETFGIGMDGIHFDQTTSKDVNKDRRFGSLG